MNIEQKFREACVQSGLASLLQQLNNQALNGLIGATLNILKQSSGNTMVGVIKAVGQTVNVSKQAGKEYLKRELVLDCSRYDPNDGTKLENYVVFEFVQKHCDDLNGFNIGERVEVKFFISGREWQDKIIHSITGYGIERIASAAVPPAPQAPAPAPQAPAPQAPAAPAAQQQEVPQNPQLPF